VLSNYADPVTEFVIARILEKHGYEVKNLARKNRIIDNPFSQGLVTLAQLCHPAYNIMPKLTKRRVTIDGISIRYQKTPDGRHCDYTPSLALLMRFPPEPPEQEHEVLELLEARRRQMNAPSGFDWDEIGERMMGRA
jgi:hypothetical protein